MSAEPQALSAGLEQILKKLQDRAYAARLERVYRAAAQAITRLSDMDLVRYETVVQDEAPDLSLWEEMAPVIRDTVMDVNALLSVIREQFPQEPSGGLADTLSRAVDEAVGQGGGSPEARRAQEASEALRKAMNQMAVQISELGEQMRNPQVVTDRWSLLATVQRYRTMFRQEIAGLVVDSASAFGDVVRRDVIPGYADEVASAVNVRSTVADLIRVIGHRQQKVREAELEDIQWHAQQLEKELDLFGRTPAYRALRAQDKRAFLELRSRAGRVAANAAARKDELLAVVDALAELVGSLRQVNNRQILIQHDREVFAATGVRLEQAQMLVATNPEAAAQALSEAALSAQALYGREPELDAFLRKARKTPLSAVPKAELGKTIEELRRLLATLPVV